MKSKEFQDLNLDIEPMSYSKEEEQALNQFMQQNEELYNQIKKELQVDFALITLKRRCMIEVYRRLNLSFAKDYWNNEDIITVCSDKDLITLLDFIKRISLK